METERLYRSVRQIRDSAFNVDDIEHYELSLQIGELDAQVCVANVDDGRCLMLEDYILKQADSIEDFVLIIDMLLDRHPVLAAGYWKKIRLIVKSNLYTLVPDEFFSEDNVADFLHPVGSLDIKSDAVYYTYHKSSELYIVFGVPTKLVDCIKEKYSAASVKILHQASPIIEGIHRYEEHTDIKNMFIFLDRKLMYVSVFDRKKLIFFNSYSFNDPTEFLKFVFGVFKSKQLNQQFSQVVFWGNVNKFSSQYRGMQKYVRFLKLGRRPSYLRYRDDFEDIEPQNYFDLYNSFKC